MTTAVTTSDYAAWLERNPPPDLQELLTAFGGYDRITPWAWERYDADLADWQAQRIRRLK